MKLINENNEDNKDKCENTKTVNLSETITLKKYRCANYDQYDILYASHMKRMYINVDETIKNEFNKFTENLLDENQITRNQLLNAIDNFPYKFQYKIKKDGNNDGNNDDTQLLNYSQWTRFTDEAFNYRPYQPCIIS